MVIRVDTHSGHHHWDTWRDGRLYFTWERYRDAHSTHITSIGEGGVSWAQIKRADSRRPLAA